MALACMLSARASSVLFPSRRSLMKKSINSSCSSRLFTVAASVTDDPDCNTEECAPDKEVGKVSMNWLAGDKTKVVGTFPPKKKGWTGYVEKDTAGQTNIYSVEPAVYVADSAISSGAAGTSSEGAENTLTITAGLAFVSVAAASLILLQVGKNTPEVRGVEYSGPPLSYYISKFQPAGIVEATAVPKTPTSPSVEASVETEVPSEVPS